MPGRLVLALALALAAALAACGGSSTPSAATPGTETGEATSTAAGAEQPAGITIPIEGGKPARGVQTVKVKHGDRVHLVVEVDAPQEIHIHGYDVEQESAPGKPAVFDFSADLEGIFDVESHATDTVIAKLEVEP